MVGASCPQVTVPLVLPRVWCRVHTLLPCRLQTGDYYVAAARRWDGNLVARDSNMFRKYVQCSYFYKGVIVGTWAQPLIKKSDIKGKKGIIQA